MRTHELKIETHYLDDLLSGEKTFELRVNDRNYQKGDKLKFYDTRAELGKPRYHTFETLSVFSGTPAFGLEKGWVILSLTPTK